MRIRIISGIAAAAVVGVVVTLGGEEVFDIACSLLAAISVYEVFGAFRAKGFRPVYTAGFCACACILLGSVEFWERGVFGWLYAIILFVDFRFLFYMALIMMFCFIIFGKEKYSVADLAVTMLGAFYVCFLFWYLIVVRNLEYGEYVVWFVILGAVATDTAAYFIGTVFGKHKLIPRISPKKTVEGALGGALACVAVFSLYGVLIFDRFAFENPIWQYMLMGAISGVITQIGDLAASAIKRYCGIKDFGKIIPGHGGILDRLDSVIILSPLIYFLVKIMLAI